MRGLNRKNRSRPGEEQNLRDAVAAAYVALQNE
jgi:hypothetical protein